MRHLVFDTETTGLILNTGRAIARQPIVIELCALVFNDKGKQIDGLDTLFKTPKGFTWDAESNKALAINKIKKEDLEKAEPFIKRAKEVQKFMEDADVVVAHNLQFDMEMMDNEFRRLDMPTIKWPKRKICTVEQTKHLKGFMLSLGVLYELLFKEKHENAHRAEADVKALARCYFELKKKGEL